MSFLYSLACKDLYLLGLTVASITKSKVWISQLGSTMCGWITEWELRKIANGIPKPSSETLPFHSLDTILIREAPTPAQYLELSWSDESKLRSCKQSLCHSSLQKPVWKWHYSCLDKIPYWRRFVNFDNCLELTIFLYGLNVVWPNT